MKERKSILEEKKTSRKNVFEVLNWLGLAVMLILIYFALVQGKFEERKCLAVCSARIDYAIIQMDNSFLKCPIDWGSFTFDYGILEGIEPYNVTNTSIYYDIDDINEVLNESKG